MQVKLSSAPRFIFCKGSLPMVGYFGGCKPGDVAHASALAAVCA
jgi:hypothetical protein